MQIVAFTNQSGSADWRIRFPSNYITSRTNNTYLVYGSDEFKGDALDSDIVIGQMWTSPNPVKEIQKQGAKFIYECDDVLFDRGKREKIQKFTQDKKVMIAKTIAQADAVTCSTEVLKEELSNYNENVFVVPNYMDFIWWGEPLKNNSAKTEVRLGWVGSFSHHEDLLYIKPVIKKLLDEFDFLRFVYCGYGGMSSTSGITELGWGKDIFKDIPPERREYIQGAPIELYPEKVKTLGLDIGIAPLVNDDFNIGKSAIKWMEYSCSLVPGVFQDSPVYNKAVRHGDTGFLAKNEQEWYDRLHWLITNEQERQLMAKRAFKEVFEKHNLEDHFNKWIDVFKTCKNK